MDTDFDLTKPNSEAILSFDKVCLCVVFLCYTHTFVYNFSLPYLYAEFLGISPFK